MAVRRGLPLAAGRRGDGQALALRETFAEIAALEHAVVFIDEVEEIAGRRGGKPPSPLQGVTNELLKIIPTFRERDGRLLVCATNFVRALDPAFLRHGRFDYVIPVGPPDAAARAAIWRRYLPTGRSNASTSTRSSRPASCSPRPTSSSRPARAHSARWSSPSTATSATGTR